MQNNSILKPRLTVAHLAFAKGWMSGLSLNELAPRYLAAFGDDDGGVDLRVAKTTLKRVLGDLGAVAFRLGIEGAGTLWRQAGRIKIEASGPSLEDFRAGLEYGDDISESELIELYKERHSDESTIAQKRSLKRRSRLVQRQLNFLQNLEPYLSAPLGWKDDVRGWFDDTLATLLVEQHIITIDALVIKIASRPDDWFSGLTSIGTVKAKRIENFLVSSLGPLDHALADKGIDVARLRFLEQPEQRQVLQLSTFNTSHNSYGNQNIFDEAVNFQLSLPISDTPRVSAINACNDYEAMQVWLGLKGSKATVSLYEREVVRLIAWSRNSRRKQLTELTVEDALAFRDFLMDVPITAQVKKGPQIGFQKRKSKVSNDLVSIPGFAQSKLSASSIKKTLVVLSGFFNWLFKVRYARANPFADVKPIPSLPGVNAGTTKATDTESLAMARVHKETVVDRTLPKEAVDAILGFLHRDHEIKDIEFAARSRFIFKFAYMTGMRISELAAARRDHLEYIPANIDGESGGWILHVIGKRLKHREVPIPQLLIDELGLYLEHRDLIALPCPALNIDPGVFLVGPYPSKNAGRKQIADGVKPQTIHLALKELFSLVANRSGFSDSHAMHQLQRSTTHWLRHTNATLSVASQVPLDVVASMLGHSSLTTTSRYIRAERSRKVTEIQKLWNLPGMQPASNFQPQP